MARVIAWFSCGAASAVAAKLSIEKHGSNCTPVYCDLFASEHPDNRRFFEDVEAWLGVPIKVISSSKYKTVDECFDHFSFMSGVKGAQCTVQMKKVPRFDFQEADDIHVFGYTVEEKKRRDDFEEHNPELFLEWPLIEAGYTKQHCMSVLARAGIKLPAMYWLGYKNNNCLGCVKATSPAYWNKIRRDFPEVFARRAEQSRRIGCKLVRVKGIRIFLDELSDGTLEDFDEDLSCGPHCAVVKD